MGLLDSFKNWFTEEEPEDVAEPGDAFAKDYQSEKIYNLNNADYCLYLEKPTEYKDLRIEYIGDSITCAWGIESASEAEPFQTTTQNFELTYAFLSAKELDADYSGVCYSGSGVAGGGNQMPKVYTQTNAFTSYNEEWDFTKFPNDVVVINLGTNDSGFAAESKQDEYISSYSQLSFSIDSCI